MRVPTETDEQIQQKSEKKSEPAASNAGDLHTRKIVGKILTAADLNTGGIQGEWEPNRAGENAYLGAESTRGFVAGSDASARI